MDPIQSRFDLAMDLIEDAAQIILPRFQQQFDIQLKKDGSYVTEVDKAVEQELRSTLNDHFPDDGIIGEEFGNKDSKSSYTWTLDPIDGTSSFVQGVPLFGTLISLLENNEPVFGIVSLPALRENYYAIKGKGAFWRSSSMNQYKPCRASECEKLETALFSYSDKVYFSMHGEDELLARFQKYCSKERVWGDCYGHMLVATGRADIMVDPYFYAWDLMPIKIILEEAGASMIDDPHPSKDGVFRGISCAKNLEASVRQLLPDS